MRRRGDDRGAGPCAALGAVAATALLVPMAGTASAEIMNPNNPFFWSCGTSREGGIRVETFGKDVRVLFEPEGAKQQELHYGGSVTVDLTGGSRGKALVFAGNDGNVSPNTDVFCSPTPCERSRHASRPHPPRPPRPPSSPPRRR